MPAPFWDVYLMTKSLLFCVLLSYNKCSIFQWCSLRLVFQLSAIRICWRNDLFGSFVHDPAHLVTFLAL